MNYKKYIAVWVSVLLCASLIGCQNTTEKTDSSTESETVVENYEEVTDVIASNSEEMFTNRDMEVGYVEEDACIISLTEMQVTGAGATVSDSSITISEEGTYIVRGEASNVQLHVNASEDAKIQIVLEGVSITNDQDAAIYIEEAKKVFVTLASDSENTFTVCQDMQDTKIDGAIYAKSNLTLNGNGTLTIVTKNNGIVTKDDLAITSGTYVINSKNHGLEGRDSVRISNGNFSITCDEDAIHSDNEKDEEKGFVYICGGTFKITAGDDGIHAQTSLTIDGGLIDIVKSYEGLEGQTIIVNAGDIRVNSSDDGFNAAGGNDNSGEKFANPFESDSSCRIEINGGNIYVNAAGDGVDSNGNLLVNGGIVFVDGPTDNGNAALDFGGTGTITGGTVIAVGSSGMAQNFGTDSTQASMLVTTTGNVNGDVVVKNSDGNVVLTYSPEKSYNCVVISSPDLVVGNTYTVTMGASETKVELAELIYGSGFDMGGPGGMHFDGGRGGKPGDRSGGSDGEKHGQKPDGAPDQNGEGEAPPELPEGFEPPEGFDPSQFDKNKAE